jgi:hypothetical protein
VTWRFKKNITNRGGSGLGLSPTFSFI